MRKLFFPQRKRKIDFGGFKVDAFGEEHRIIFQKEDI